MKDLRSSLGAGTFPAKEYTSGTIKALVVRNLGQYGRRVAIYTDEGELVVGGRVHAADFQHTPKYAAAPEGFQTGLSVELAAKREYVEIFSFIAPATFDIIARKKGASQQVRMSSALTHGLEDSTEYNPAVAVNEFQTGNLSLEPGFIGRNFASFTIEVDGTLHDIAFDVMKHPARMTADVNYQLFAIHPQLRCVVAMAEDYEAAEAGPGWSVFFSEPKGVQVRFPQTNYANVPYEVATDGTLGFGQFQIAHLNNYLEQPIEIVGSEAVSYEAVVVEDPRLPTAPDITTLVTSAVMNNQEIYPEGNIWSPEITLQPGDFHTLAEDPRFKVALVGLSPDFNNGDIYYLNKVEVVTGEISKLAELLPAMGTRADGKQYSTRLIDLDASVEAGKLVGTSLVDIGTDSKQAFITRTSLNELQFGKNLAIAVLVPAAGFNRFAPLFRTPAANVTVELNFTRDHVTKPGFVLVDDVYEWSKEVDARAPVALNLPVIPNAIVEKAIAVHATGTIEELNPVLVETNGEWQIQFQDGFSQRDLTFGQTSGSIDFALELKRTAANGSASTNLHWEEQKDYSVSLPTVHGQMELQSIPPVVVDPVNNDLVIFQGVLNLPLTSPEGTRNPLYYCSNVDFTANVNDKEAAVASGVFVEPNNYGQDAPGLFSFSIAKSILSDFGPGLHTLNISASLDLLWNETATILGSVQFRNESEISCEGAPATVALDIDGQWDLVIEGEVVGSGTMDELKPLALAQGVQIITECQPSTVEVEDKLLTYNDSDMLCVAYQIDDEPVRTKVIEASSFRLTMGAQSYFDPNAPEYPTYYSTAPFLQNVYELGKYVNFENVDEGYRNIAETSAPCINGEVYITRKRIWMSPLRSADWMGVDGQTLKLSLEFNGATHVVETPVNTEQNWDFVSLGYLEEKLLYQELATQLSAIPGLVAEAGEGHIATNIVGGDEIPYRWVLMLSFDQSSGLEIDLNTANNIPAPSGRNTAWVEGHPEYQSTMCKLGLVPTSEFVNGKFTITGKPKLGPNLIPENHQIVIGSFAEFGLELPPNGVDYMVVNNIPKLEIHSCGASRNIVNY